METPHTKKTKKKHSTGRIFLTKKNLRQKTNQKYEQPTICLNIAWSREKNTPSKIEVFSILTKPTKTQGFWGVDPGMMEKPKKRDGDRQPEHA